MPINYVVTPRVNPKDLTAPRKFYAIAKSNGEETVRQLATEISKRNGLSTSDVFAVLESLIDLVPERLSEGRIVRLGEFGSFSISLSSEGVERAEDFTAANIKSNSLNFRPGKLVQNVLNISDYKKVQE